MITGVVCILLGEAAITASGWLLLWSAIFFGVLAVFIRCWEEPHLKKRYGNEYIEYRRNVPSWIPRLSAWIQAGKATPKKAELVRIPLSASGFRRSVEDSRVLTRFRANEHPHCCYRIDIRP